MITADTLDPAIIGPASRFTLERDQASLGDTVEQLAGLRFAIVLSARWESSASSAPMNVPSSAPSSKSCACAIATRSTRSR